MGVSHNFSEAYADELMDGVDVESHQGGESSAVRGRFPVNLHAWLQIVGALALLWLIGGVIFKGVNI